MKWFFIIVFLLTSSAVFAQRQGEDVRLTLSIELSDNQLVDKLEGHFKLPEGHRLELDNSTVYPGRKHLRFNHYFYGKRVLHSGMNVHLYDGHKALVQPYLETATIPMDLLDSDLPLILWTPDGYQAVRKVLSNDGQHWSYQTDDGQVREEWDRYLNYKDTTVKAKVFLVNPLNTAKTFYGGQYVDNSDNSSAVLEAEQYVVDLYAQYENGQFILRHPKIAFKEISGPYLNDSFIFADDTFFYDRSESRFEAANAFYHLVNLNDYLKALGYEALVKKVEVDVHALSGSDNSQFDPEAYTIEYGDGGVDDAEDGEVVIHEFMHAISTTANFTSNNSNQRQAMEEGNCDYLSKSYSRSVNDHHSYMVFSWDGHNQFWSGFWINSNDHYPEDLRNTKDGDRDMWSSTLMCIHDYIGREATDSLVLEHLSYQKRTGTMLEMADILLHIDTVLFNNRYHDPIKECLVARGFSNYTLSVAPQDSQRSAMLLNSLAFMQGMQPLEIKKDGTFDYTVIDGLGRVVLEGQAVDRLQITPFELVKGCYTLRLSDLSGYSAIKFVR